MTFWRHKLPEVTNEAYSRWLRAQRPPWLWFLGRTVLEQEQLAILGDAYIEGCIAAGADIGAELETEETRLRQLIVNTVQGRQNGPGSPPPSAPLSMGGVTKRQEERDQEAQAAKDKGKRFFGREPDTPDVGDRP